uniref:WH2 domain-containing protein n=1 Tax=Meloidogyne floridensis TaxID=298350 RepID=A0A915NYG7_9BILA
MESDKYIVVREKNDMVIINVANPNVVERKQISDEVKSIIMHPTRRILAFESFKNRLFIFDMHRNVKMKAFTVKKEVDFWTWIDSNTIGFVTKTSVYHWTLNDDSEPTKLSTRSLSLRSKLITNYKATADGKFFLLVGVKSKDGQTVGIMQICTKERGVTHLMDAHAGCFAQFKMEGSSNPINLLCYSLRKSDKEGKLTIKELKTPTGNKQYTKKSVDFVYSYGIPLSMQASSAYGILYMITDYGYVHVFEIETCCSIYRVSIPVATIFITTEHTSNNGFLAISESGKLRNPDLALKLSSRLKLASESMGNVGRKPIPMPWKTESSNGEDKNVSEGKKHLVEELIEELISENKLECSEELGDLVKQYDVNLAMSIYLRGSVPHKVVQCLAETGQYDKIIPYVRKANYEPDYLFLMRQVLRTHPENSTAFAQMLVSEGPTEKPLADINKIVDCFVEVGNIQQCTTFLLEILKGDSKSQSHLQTRLLEMNLLSNPPVADAILENRRFSYYDRAAIGQLCEKAGLLQRALEHFTDLYDIKRTIVHTTLFNPEWLINYFGRLNAQDALECLKAMLQANHRQSLQIVMQIASKYSEKFTTQTLIDLFESFKSYEAVSDTKSLGTSSTSSLFHSDEHLSIKETNSSMTSSISNESKIEERPKLDSCSEEKIKNDVVKVTSLSQIKSPPPLPPPKPLQHVSDTKGLGTILQKFQEAAKTISGRSDLMAAIRATGGVQGAGLKSVKRVNNEVKTANNKKNVGEDLMTSLTRVLTIRRRGILGIQNSSTSRSLGDVLREHIPTRSRTGSSSEEDQNSSEVDPNEWGDDK